MCAQLQSKHLWRWFRPDFITPNVRRIVDQAYTEANRLKDEFASTEHIFLAILNEKALGRKAPGGDGKYPTKVYELIVKMRDGKHVTEQAGEDSL